LFEISVAVWFCFFSGYVTVPKMFRGVISYCQLY